MKKWINSIIVLSSSFSTLICCVLPALFVSLGLGSTLVSIIDFFPIIPWLSQYKWTIFIIAGLLLIFNHFNLKKQMCSIENPEDCLRIYKVNKIINNIAIIIYITSLLFNLFILIN